MKNASDNSRRRTALLALIGGGVGLSGLLQNVLAQNPPRTQGLQRMRGEVRVNGNVASAGTPVQGGDSVETSPGGFAVLVVGQDAFLLRDNTRVDFAGSGQLLDVVRLVSGKLLGVFATGGNRQLQTPTASIGIRGTGAYLEADPQRTYFCLCYGSADVAANNSEARASYSTMHHESPRYIYGDGRSDAIVPASVTNHTDSELVMLETLVGRSPPTGFMEAPYRY